MTVRLVRILDSGLGTVKGLLLDPTELPMTRLASFVVAILAASFAQGAAAQDSGLGRQFSADLGIGVSIDPAFPGADDMKAGPWVIWRNAGFGDGAWLDRDGLSFSPSLNLEGAREAADNPDLTGLDDIDRAVELGLKVSYGAGPIDAFATLRKGVSGHSGLTGEVGAKYRSDLGDRVTLWSGISLGYGDGDYNSTYFGVTPSESSTSGYAAFAPGGGFNRATITLEARYALTETTALLGGVNYGRLIGDAADSPVVQDRYQPSLRLGIVRRFSFGF